MNRSFRVILVIFVFGLSMKLVCAEVNQMRVLIVQLQSSLPVETNGLLVTAVEQELDKADQYFTVLQRSNLEDLFSEVALSYEDWMSEYKGSSEAVAKMQGLTADHILFLKMGRSGSEFFISADVTKIETTEKMSTTYESDTDLASLRINKIPKLVSAIVKKHFESIVHIKTGVNKVNCSIRDMNDPNGFRRDFTINGAHTLDMPYGVYNLTFKKKNYRDQAVPLKVNDPREEVTFHSQRKEAMIILNGRPKSVNIEIDGEPVAKEFPLQKIYPEGKYSIVVKKLGYSEWTKKVEIWDQQDQVFQNIVLKRPPRMGAMVKSAFLPGFGQYSLGYKKKGLVTGTGYVLAAGVGIFAFQQHKLALDEYNQLSEIYENMESGDFDAARDEALSAHSRLKLWDIVRISGAVSAGSIWVWSGIDTWFSSGIPKSHALHMDVSTNGVSLSYVF
jgi:hypothetical protein